MAEPHKVKCEEKKQGANIRYPLHYGKPYLECTFVMYNAYDLSICYDHDFLRSSTLSELVARCHKGRHGRA